MTNIKQMVRSAVAEFLRIDDKDEETRQFFTNFVIDTLNASPVEGEKIRKRLLKALREVD